jgi:hypothetical protein
MRTRNVEVVGGYNINEEQGQGKDKRTVHIFMEKKRVVCPEDKLAALFRRDWELCSMPVIQIHNTNRQPTILI